MPFNPIEHLIPFNGKKYLPVAARIAWFREDYPDGLIHTDHIELTDERAVFRAVVTKEIEGGTATGYGSETPRDFRDYIEKAECLKDDTEILTRHGFRHHSQVNVGDDVLAYDLETDRCVWTPMRRKVTYQDAPVVRIGHRDFEAVVTPNHTWATAGTYRSWVTGEAPRRMKETRHLNTSDRIILAAPAPGGESQVTPDEAAILGWLITDGTIWRERGDLQPRIYQSKEPQVDRVRELVGTIARESVGLPTTRTFPTGRTYDCKPNHVFHLPAPIIRAMMAKVGIERYADVPSIIHSLSQPARAAMLEAMMDADGDTRGYFGKIAKPGVQEAWQILCTLEGIAVGKRKNEEVFPVQRMKRRRYVSCQSGFTVEDAGTADVWCPQTDFGTWVARMPTGQVTITGNTKAIGRALAALGFGTQFALEFGEGDRIVDAPQSPRTNTAPSQGSAPRSQATTSQSAAQRAPAASGKITAAQVKAITTMAARAGMEDDAILDYARSVAAEAIASLDDLSEGGARDVIGSLGRDQG